MSATEKAIGVVKNVLLFRETLDRMDARLNRLSDGLEAHARSHAELAERVADIEGYLRAATGAPFGGARKIERK